ncbi:ABC transporter substrate-binding protein [Aneurinibacillus tyrosinisolvens]|uniref:ABC transporter substrate-binding protein n=1 Tax=Aneurinibacillus tyrosinisolvens TaxID=1443435 RepID=UPI00069B146B|nr:ABC transporter substrate-binding protein [Aneurinibacillus tyrosinisolvens]
MRKWTVMFLVFLLALTGCSGKSVQNSEGKATKATEEKTIKILTHWDANNSKAFDSLIAEYEAANPGVKIKLQTVPFAELLKKITSSKLSNDGPDIYHIYSAWLPELARSKAIQTAPENITADIKQGYGENIKNSVSIEGNVYGYPTELTAYALNYNKRLFTEAGIAQPPKDWNELVADAKKLTKTENGKITQQGFGVITGWDSGVVHPWLALLQSNGGELLNADNAKAAFNSPQGKEAIDLYKSLLDANALNPEMSQSNASTTGGYQNNFELEKTAMIIMANWWKGDLEATMKDKYKNVATAPIPVGPSGTKPISVFYSWLYSVNAKGNNQEEAWKFLHWLNTAKAEGQSSRQGDWLINQGILPSRTDDQKAHKDKLDDPFIKTYVDLLKDAKPFPNVMNGAEITAALQKQIEGVVFGQSAPADALKNAESQINNLLNK